MEITPTRSALLESRDERVVMREGYRFLDEKRLLLAAEIIRQHTRYLELHTRYLEQHARAVALLADWIGRCGLHDVQVSPVQELTQAQITGQAQSFFGVMLRDAPRLTLHDPAEKNRCAQAFTTLLAQGSELATISGNLHRLLAEYQRTERRARALEDVILPELDGAIHEMEIRLEEMEQEDAVRVRLQR
ncbi:MAG: ATPase [Magnetococcales bacterium]|nr:V-type ATP synthase subunit D [Magnetococcales bacterium]NGZ04841.1 ATPase [Magnetococcales bacterium]